MAGRSNNLSPAGSASSETEFRAASENSSKLDQDRLLPIANVSRIMKKSLPANAKISKEAKETVQECVSEFISFVTGEASEKCAREKRKTINGDDLLWAMTTLGFENYAGPLKLYLNQHRDVEEERNSMARQGDQSPVEETKSCDNNSNNPTPATGLSSFNHGFYSVSGRDFGGKIVGFGEPSKMGGLRMTGAKENGGGGRSIVSATQSHGVQW